MAFTIVETVPLVTTRMTRSRTAPIRVSSATRTRARTARLVPDRLGAQRLSQSDFSSPEAVVAAFGAIQAQDLAGSRWAVGLRVQGIAAESDIEKALDAGSIIRTHAMRGTWQLVAAEDVRWLIALVGPRTVAKYRSRRKQLGADASVLETCTAAMRHALERDGPLERTDIRRVLTAAKIQLKDEALSHVLMCAELAGVVCSGPRRGKQTTYALLDARIPSPGPRFTLEEAAAELARRYLSTRGPACVEDFAWWSGLSVAECRAAFASIASDLVETSFNARRYFQASASPRPISRITAQLVPAFDEYLIAYKDRSAMVLPEHARRVNGGGGMLNPCVLLDGRVVGLWKRTLNREGVDIALHLFERASNSEERLLTNAAERYAAFLGRKPSIRFERLHGRFGKNGQWMFG
jgi:hypothetical protein